MPRITPIHWRKLRRIFELDGAYFIGQTGDHIELKNPGSKRRLVIPMYKNVPIYIIKNNMRTVGMKRKRYFELLKKV